MILYVLSWIAIKADRRGVTALEYGIIASVLAIGLVAVFRTFGNNLSSLFTRVGSSL